MHAGQREVERRRHAVELERVDEQGAVADLASGAGAEKAAQLRMQVAAALRGLVLEAAERRELALGIEHTLHRRRADGADQLVFQVGIAGIEAVVLDALVRGHAGTLEAAPHVAQLGDVAEPGQPHAQALRTERLHEALQVGGAADGDDDDAFGLQVAAATAGEGFEGGLVAPAFDEDGGMRVNSDHEVTRVVGGSRRARARRRWRRCRRFHVRIMPSCRCCSAEGCRRGVCWQFGTDVFHAPLRLTRTSASNSSEPMSSEQRQIEVAISALESQRSLLGDELTDAALGPLRAKLAALIEGEAVPTHTLKQVTILFLDVVNSTTLSRQLDPEDIHSVIDGALARCTRVVEGHQGKVLQYAGDSLLAVFGADGAREDDPERAVNAGLALLAEGRSLAEQARNQYGQDGIDVRVGVHTGSALLGSGVYEEDSVRGVAVNIAARMEQTAPPGGLRMSQDTYRHVSGKFEVEPQRPMAIEGLADFVTTYLVLRAKPRTFRVGTRDTEEVRSRLVGRDRELDELRDVFRHVCMHGQLTFLTIVAEAGIGKSRLLFEFEDWAQALPEPFHTFHGRASPQTQSQPYGLLRDIIAGRLQLADGDDMASAKEKVEQGIVPLFLRQGDDEDMAQAHAHLVGYLIGLDFAQSRHIKAIAQDGKQIRDRGFHAVAQMFRHLAVQNSVPIVLQLDDLHWADDGSLDFLNYLAQVNGDVPMLVLGVARPALFERSRDWGDEAVARRRIELPPLNESDSGLLVDALLEKMEETPSSLRDLISVRSEGNPFYMEELVKMLVDQGAIEIVDERWRFNPEKLLANALPQTLTGVLQARLDRLPPAERLALQQASVVGLVFWDRALAAISARATDSLPSVTRRGLVIRRPNGEMEGMLEYAFGNQSLHRVTYDTVIKRLRREYHAKTAAWLVSLNNTRADDFLGMAAEHFEMAGDFLKAREYFARSAEHLAGRYAHQAALGYISKALALAGQDKDAETLSLRWRLLKVRERTLDMLGRRAEQRADIDTLEQIADDLDDDRLRAEAALRRSGLSIRTADYRTGESAARQALSAAQRTGDDEISLHAQHRLAISVHQLGDAYQGRVLAQSGLETARRKGLHDLEARFLYALAFMSSIQWDPMGYLELAQQTVLTIRELGDRQAEASALGNLGTAWLGLGEWSEARRHLDEALRLTRSVGLRHAESHTLLMLSEIAYVHGDEALALAHVRSALDICVAVQDPFTQVLALLFLGKIELAQQHCAAAKTAYEAALTGAVAINHVLQDEARAGLAKVALAEGNIERAMQEVEGLVGGLSALGETYRGRTLIFVQLTCYQVLARFGDARAGQILQIGYDELQARAAAITDTKLRDSFLNNVPVHRQVVTAWAALRAESSCPP